MKKRIILTSTAVVLFALVSLTSVFFILDRIVSVEQTREQLSVYNEIFINDLQWEDNVDKYKIDGHEVRFTLINKYGEVIFDTEGEVSSDHSDREEIIDAFENGTGYSNRYSETVDEDLLYFATKISEDLVIRSAVEIQNIHILTGGKATYYIAVIVVIAILSLILSIKLVKVIIYPIKELETVTSKIKDGDLSRRAIIYNNDEIGSLARNFNKMADQLQIKINDAVDKQSKIEAIIESMENGVLAVDSEGEIILINSYVKKLFGIKGEVIGEKISEYIIDYEVLEFARDVQYIGYKEIKIYHPKEKYIKLKKAPIISEHDNTIGIVISISDITDIKRLENMRSQFVANVTHELKTPLTSIKGFSETLRYVEDKVTRVKFLDIIESESNRLTRLINDILILSDIENRNKMREEEFDPVEVIIASIEIVKMEANKKNIKVNLNNKYNGYLLGERDKFNQLVLNLIDNAIKYSEENGQVNITCQEVNGKIKIDVEDSGIGIPKEDLPRIFERFYRVDKSRATKGTGLGLAIAKHIVKLFGGDINVSSDVGKGTIFTVII